MTDQITSQALPSDESVPVETTPAALDADVAENVAPAPVEASPTPAVPLKRVFKIGATRIVEDASMAALNNEQIRALLKNMYPEVANATIRERVEGDLKLIDFLMSPGRKG